MARSLFALLLLAPAGTLSVGDTPTTARTPKGHYISWREHLIDDQQLSGVPLRGGDGLQLADFDKDGHADIVSVHEDSHHVRLAFGSGNPDRWTLATLAEGDEAKAAEDASVADLNRDGWPDIIVACELAHLIYFQNPGEAGKVRSGKWPRVIPANTRERGSFIRVFFADFNGDGRVEVVSPNKGDQLGTVNPLTQNDGDHPPKPISWFAPPSDPLSPRGWQETVLTKVPIPINSQPVDIDGDGDPDIVAGSRGQSRTIVFENVSNRKGAIRFKEHRVEVTGRTVPQQPGSKRLTAFMVDFHDFNGDGRLDMVMNETPVSIAWLEQPVSLDLPWKLHLIGDIAPDSPTGITVADIDSDGRSDIITGGYSQDPRDHDGANIGHNSVCGRLTWFRNPGPGASGKPWPRHDISRRKRGMYDAFVARDMDGDGDPDFLATRGNSGNFDGVFWLEQVRSAEPRKSFSAARAKESEPVNLP
jgi:hypothetical protein